MYKATRWAEEARQTTTFIWWNVWVLLAMPAVWLAWAMFFLHHSHSRLRMAVRLIIGPCRPCIALNNR